MSTPIASVAVQEKSSFQNRVSFSHPQSEGMTDTTPIIPTAKESVFDIDTIYTPLEEAKEEVWRRWNDKALRAKVEEVQKSLLLTPLTL
jgi:hypothetical protein